jgi:DNA-binding MarR family transcriptional regulator
LARRTGGREILPEWGNGPLTVSRAELMTEGSDRHFRGMIHALVGYANCVLAAREAFATLLGITGVQYEIVMVIYRLHATEPCSVSEVAAQVRRTVAFITIEINKLVDKGFVEKQADFKDGRRVLLRVTARAIKRLQDIAPVQRRLNDALFRTISASEFRSLCRLYDKLGVTGPEAADLANRIVQDATQAVQRTRAQRT